MVDPVMQDLNRHLSEREAAEARSEAIDAIVDEWMTDPEVLQGTIEDILECGSLNLPIDLAGILLAHSEDKLAHMTRFLEAFEKAIRSELEGRAEDEYRARQRQAKLDEGEQRFMDLEDGLC